MVQQAKLEAKEVARKVLMKQVEHVKDQFEAEIKEVLYHNSFILDESNKKDFQIKQLIKKIQQQELIISLCKNYFRK